MRPVPVQRSHLVQYSSLVRVLSSLLRPDQQRVENPTRLKPAQRSWYYGIVSDFDATSLQTEDIYNQSSRAG